MTHYDILPPEQKIVLPQLQPTRRLGFVLYGGTAIALQLGHRESVDFDFFSDRDIDDELLRKSMPLLENAETTQRAPNTWSMNVRPDPNGRTVKLSFFGGFKFGRVGKPLLTDDKELLMASLSDLMGHKLKVLLDRVEAKDYMDIAAMLRNGQKLEDGLGAASALFKNFPAGDAVRALTYFEGGDLGRLAQTDKDTLVQHAAAVSRMTPTEILSARLGISPPMRDEFQRSLGH
jgi:hypothetical protein